MTINIVAITNQKGGVDKTISTINLGIGLAHEGNRVLLVDCDPQDSMTINLGWTQPDELPITLSTLMGRAMMDFPIHPEESILRHAEGVGIIPANLELSGLEVSLVNVMSRKTVLRQVLDSVKPNYDFILIDRMPSLGMLSINALTAADSVIIPVQAHYLPLKGLIGKVTRQMNPMLRIEGILPTMIDRRTNYGKDISQLMRENYGSKIRVFDTDIPLSVRISSIFVCAASSFALCLTLPQYIMLLFTWKVLTTMQ